MLSRAMAGRLAAGTAALSAIALFTSCSASRPSPESVTQDFLRAVGTENWEHACANLSDEFLQRNMNGRMEYCMDYLRQWHESPQEFTAMEVPRQTVMATPAGAQVTVQLPDGERASAHVVYEHDSVKIADYPGLEDAQR